MKNNLVKAVASLATATTLLFSTATCFAATANTVTTYGTDGINVTSTVSEIKEGVMVTYLAGSDNGEIASKDDIQYITQWTSAGESEVKTISYNLKTIPNTNPLATVKYGSDNSDVATALNTDANKTVQVAGISATYKEDEVSLFVDEKVGSGDAATAIIKVFDGYEVVSITVNGNPIDKESITFEIPYNGDNTSVVIETQKTISAPTVATAVITDLVTVTDSKGAVVPSIGAVGQITGDTPVEFGIYVEKGGVPFAFGDVTDGYFAALPALDGTDSSYYAVNIADGALTGDYSICTYAKFADGREIKGTAGNATAK
ncbi:MAG: hypothetical protein IJ460_06470 [Clostridia bacterium]|nr:hypothetical protein [Clostridia bacterium]